MRVDPRRLVANKKYCEAVFRQFLNTESITEDRSRLFGKHLNRSLKNLQFANFLMEEHKHSIKEKLSGQTFYEWCITVYYYSLYHAALALVTKAGYKSRNHLATITCITLLYFHKENFLQKEDIELLIQRISINRQDIDLVLGSKDLRERACYSPDTLFERKQAESLRKETADFVNKIRLFLAD